VSTASKSANNIDPSSTLNKKGQNRTLIYCMHDLGTKKISALLGLKGPNFELSCVSYVFVDPGLLPHTCRHLTVYNLILNYLGPDGEESSIFNREAILEADHAIWNSS
jgi:hypothetical protein